MSLAMYTASIAELYSSLADIAANVNYIQDELPVCDLSDAERSHIGKTCEEFEGAIYDVRKEIRNLEDKLGMHPGQPPFDPDIRNPDPQVTMGFIGDWLLTEIKAMHETVLRLQAASSVAPDHGRAYLLVGESATNILRAYANARQALDAIGAQLEQKGEHPGGP